MNKFIILTESGADLPMDVARLHHIYVLPMHVAMGDMHYLDGFLPITDVYDYYEKDNKIPTTSAVCPDEYKSVFTKIIEENPDCTILHISYSSQVSCTYQNALIASEGMENIYHIDSLNVSGGAAAIVLKAVDLIEEYPDIRPAELIKKIEWYVDMARASFIPENLEYPRRGGRVSNAAYLGATVLKLKPLIEIVKGKLISKKKFRGSMIHIVEKYLNEFIDGYNMDKNQIYLLYSLGLAEGIKQIMEEIVKRKGFRKFVWIQTGCVISIHCGPGAIGVAGFEI